MGDIVAIYDQHKMTIDIALMHGGGGLGAMNNVFSFFTPSKYIESPHRRETTKLFHTKFEQKRLKLSPACDKQHCLPHFSLLLSFLVFENIIIACLPENQFSWFFRTFFLLACLPENGPTWLFSLFWQVAIVAHCNVSGWVDICLESSPSIELISGCVILLQCNVSYDDDDDDDDFDFDDDDNAAPKQGFDLDRDDI